MGGEDLSMYKRRKTAPAAEHEAVPDDDGILATLPDDSLVAVEVLRKQYPKSPSAGAYPAVFVSQVYSLVRSRTTVDRELDQAAKDKRIRMLRVPGHPTDGFLLAMTDYLAAIDAARLSYLRAGAAGSSRKGGAPPARGGGEEGGEEEDGGAAARRVEAEAREVDQVFKRFRGRVTPACPRVAVATAELLTLLAPPPKGKDKEPAGGCGGASTATRGGKEGGAGKGKDAEQGGAKRGGEGVVVGGVARVAPPLKREWVKSAAEKEEAAEAESAARAAKARAAIDVLNHARLLTRKDANSYWFTLPGCGPLMAELSNGRTEMLEVIRRKKFGEMLVKEAEGRKLKASTLGCRFHLRDLIGRGALQLVHTTSGGMVKLVSTRE